MPEGSYELVRTGDGGTARIAARGAAVLADPDDQPRHGVHPPNSAASWA